MAGRGLGRGMDLFIQQMNATRSTLNDTVTSTDTDRNTTIGSGSGSSRGLMFGRGLARALERSKASSNSDKTIKSDSDKKDSGVKTDTTFSSKALTSSGPSDDANVTQTTHSSGRGSSNGPRVMGRGLSIVLAKMESAMKLEKVSEGESKKTESVSSVSTYKVERNLEPVLKHGKEGTPYQIVANYIRLESVPDMGIFEYEVRFEPDVESISFRHKYLSQHRDVIGDVKTFDGVLLYLPRLLKDSTTVLQCQHPVDGSVVWVKLTFKKKKRIQDCMQFYNILFDRIFKILKYQRVGKKNFDPSTPFMIPQHRLEVWPGYVKAVEEQEGGVMLCLDVSHRILNQYTVYEFIRDIYKEKPQRFKEELLKALIGRVILTKYNNKTYRIDDIAFDETPLSTFHTVEKEVTYVEYYKMAYGITIHDHKQPLLINRKEVKIPGQTEKKEMTFCMVPEICYLTGLEDKMRNDHRVMKDLATYTRLTPNQRCLAIRKFAENVNSNEEAKNVLKAWGLRLDTKQLHLTGRVLNEESVFFGKNRTCTTGPNADFSRGATSNEVIEAVHLKNWLVVFCERDRNLAKDFVDWYMQVCNPMGVSASAPILEKLNNDKTETYVQALRRHLNNPNLQIVVIIFPTQRDDRYAAVKRICCTENPVPSQVINANTLRNDKKNRSIVQKIALQMNCKLGGTLWAIKIPLKNVMICGIDTYHDANMKGNSVSAFVASINATFTKWYSKATIQNKKEEMANALSYSLEQALGAYKSKNQQYPDRLIIYRDGVGDGQLQYVEHYEISQLKTACQNIDPNYNPAITYVVVQKRINTKLMAVSAKGEENPKPGLVVDHTITRKYMYDFFLVPQSVRQGTVTPSHYIVLKDTCDFAPDVLQRLTYKMTFLYYNWPGAVRVPACCQYAHKLAYLIGMSVKRPASEKLCDKLFYL